MKTVLTYTDILLIKVDMYSTFQLYSKKRQNKSKY